MMDTLRRQTSANLNRDAGAIAENAAQRVLSSDRSLFPLPGATGSNIDATRGSKSPDLHAGDEAQGMLQDGFRRLSQVLALSVLVEEPGIVRDHLQWLGSLSPAARSTDGESASLPYLLDCFSAACEEMLSPGQFALVKAVLDEALDSSPGTAQ